MKFKLSELISLFGGELVGEDVTITGISSVNQATSSQITFLSDNRYKQDLVNCNAAAIIIDNNCSNLSTLPKIITNNPYYYFSLVSQLFYPRSKIEISIAKSAVLHPTVQLGANPAIAANVVIEQDTSIGANCQIHANVVIGSKVTIGNNVTLYPNVTIYETVKIGDDCVIHSGVVIGSDGFGNAQDEHKNYHRIPQIGGVIIGNKVEIGANTTIDCGTFEATIIENGVRIDNLVQIGHNVVIGEHSGIAANVGIAGGAKIGKYCMIAGGCGIGGHLSIADHTVISGASNVGKSIINPGLYGCGLTVMDYKSWAKTVAYIKNLDKLNSKVKELEKKLASFEGKL